jgi:hypothetical protein
METMISVSVTIIVICNVLRIFMEAGFFIYWQVSKTLKELKED